MTVQQDRRDVRARRIPFEALVEIGGDGTPAFEAECVDISTGGMHLRSAYLPELGQPIVCRFDSGNGDPICAEGHVVWRDEGALGGELGIQFTQIDEPSAEALLEMCGVVVEPEEVAPPSEPPASAPAAEPRIGSRVRLHIEGLASPMKARVRTIGDKQVVVGANLEFLRLGRALDVASAHDKRPAKVERVSVDVDPASKMPQLVVELRYLEADQEAPKVATMAPAPAAAQAPPRPEQAPATVTTRDEGGAPASSIEEAPAEEDELLAAPHEEAAAYEPSFHTRVAESSDAPLGDDEVEVAHKLKDGLSRAASIALPKLAQVGSRAKTTVELLFAKAKATDEVMDEGAHSSPRRTTAPPPSGVLQASGRRLVREEESQSVDTPRMNKRRSRAIALGAAAGVATVLILALSRGGSDAKPVDGDELALVSAQAADPAALDAPTVTEAGALETPPDVVVANVPLFGPTPLSTTFVPSVPAPGEDGSTPAPALAEAEDESAFEDDPDFPTARPSAPAREVAPKAAAKKVATFSHGKVTQPKTLRLRMDDDITALRGSRSKDGFTITLPDRRAKEKAGPLASKDDRILLSRILNSGKGAELTMRFKDAVPAFAVRADGNHLVIELETAKKTKPSATAKKAPRSKTN